MKHNLIPQTTRSLIYLRGTLLGTLKNPKCEALKEPVSDTIKQINAELLKRGIKPLK